MSLLSKLRRRLQHLPDDATTDTIKAELLSIIEEDDGEEMNDPRLVLRRAVDKRAAERGISFTAALKELSEKSPELIHRVSEYYAKER